MAGIGFELKKIFKEESITSTLQGIGYSTLITVGPTILVILTILILYRLLGYLRVSYVERELLSSTILYVFIFSLLVTAPFNGVFSRYIADKIYEESLDNILASFYVGLTINIVVGAFMGIPVLIRLIVVGGISPIFAFVSYLLFMILILVFFSMIYLSATKNYKIIAVCFFIGMFFAFFTALGFFYFCRLSVIKSILYGLTIGFFIISFSEFAYIKRYFYINNHNYMESVRYIKEFKGIFFSNFLYILGLYIHNFVMWTTPARMTVGKTYVSMQSYDMASCLAMFSNISAMVIFTVMAETKFHEKYQIYTEAVIGATRKEIVRAKRKMFRLLMEQISYIVEIQAIITAIFFLLAIVFLPGMGFGGLTMKIYPVLSVAYLVIFVMYGNIIFLYYFNDNKGTLITSIIFCVVTGLATLISKELEPIFFGAGALIGAFSGWTFSFLRIRYLEKNLDRHIFCHGQILKEYQRDLPDAVVYKRGEEEKLS